MSNPKLSFIYIMDPMCSWCYAFQSQLEAFLQTQLDGPIQPNGLEMNWLMGGLAPDATEPMDAEFRQTLAGYWQKIEEATGTPFNHEFWETQTPIRSTYPACRAVIAADQIKPGMAPAMVKAIQQAYYQDALNPSLDQTLIDCAKVIGIPDDVFVSAYQSEGIEQIFVHQMQIAEQLQVQGFPALFVVAAKEDEAASAYPLALGYCETSHLTEQFKHIVDQVLS